MKEHTIAQGRSYGGELDEDRAWRCSWNTWRTLTDLLPIVRALLAEHDTEQEPSTDVLAEVLPLHRSTLGSAA